jgi:putative inorganic carbon (hco3(-)) transporter
MMYSEYGYTMNKGEAKGWLIRNFIEKKLNSVIGISLIVLLSILTGYLGSMVDYRAGLGLVCVALGVLLVILLMRYPYFGLYFILVYSVSQSLIYRNLDYMHLDLPINLLFVQDFLVIVLFISVLDKPKLYRNVMNGVWKNPIIIAFVITFLYYALQALNPAKNMLGWVSYFEKFCISMLTFYVLLCLLHSWNTIRFFIIFNIVLATLMAVYSCKQQWFGLAGFETYWLTSSPRQYALSFQGGLLRKWSILSDAATAGVLFASVAIQSLILFFRTSEKKLKLLLGLAVMFNFLGFTFSGTRTATLMLVVGIAFYAICTFYERRTKIMLVLVISAFAFIMVSPYSPPSIMRIRSAFQGTKDPSAALRDINRHAVQPYLYRHPFGGGVFTCGVEGPKYNPGHPLMNFQPDGGYMKVFAEQGWVGLLVMISAFYLMMNYAIGRFYRTNNPEMQNHDIAISMMIFSLMVGQFSQITITNLLPISLLGSLAFLVKLPSIDTKQTLKPIQQTL